jgi:hypothetical protein
MYKYIYVFKSDDFCQSRVTADEADGAVSKAAGLLKLRLHAVCETQQATKDRTDESF